jgi:hypothetical protein
MSKLAWMSLLVALATVPAIAETAIPDMKGTWIGESESIVLGRGNQHHRAKAAAAAAEPRLSSVKFTMVIDKQDGRRFSGKFSSARGTETVIAVITRSGQILLIDDDGYSFGTMLGPDKIDLCYMQQNPAMRIASCTELTKQP